MASKEIKAIAAGAVAAIDVALALKIAGTGAAIGTMILPGIGTVFGVAGGALVGGVVATGMYFIASNTETAEKLKQYVSKNGAEALQVMYNHAKEKLSNFPNKEIKYLAPMTIENGNVGIGIMGGA